MEPQGMSAYNPTQESASQPPEIPQKRSGIPKVLGIAHLVIAGLGLFSFVSNLLSGGMASESLRAQLTSSSGEVGLVMSDDTYEALQKIDGPFQVIGYFDMLTVFLLIIAGVGLIRYQKWGRYLSNVYVLVTLLVKASTIYVFAVVADAFFEKWIGENALLEQMGVGLFKAMFIVPIVLLSFYAFLTLFLVNRKKVKLSLD